MPRGLQDFNTVSSLWNWWMSRLLCFWNWSSEIQPMIFRANSPVCWKSSHAQCHLRNLHAILTVWHGEEFRFIVSWKMKSQGSKATWCWCIQIYMFLDMIHFWNKYSGYIYMNIIYIYIIIYGIIYLHMHILWEHLWSVLKRRREWHMRPPARIFSAFQKFGRTERTEREDRSVVGIGTGT